MTRPHATTAVLIAGALAVSSCGGDDDSAGTPATTTTTITVAPNDEAGMGGDQPTSSTADVGTDAQTDDAADPDATIVLPPPCPTDSAVPELEPADVDAAAFPPPGTSLEPGRYTTDVLGLSFAVDVPDLFDDAGSFGRSVGLFGGFGDRSFGFARPDADGFVTDLPSDEDFARGAESETVDFDTWLAQPGIAVVEETAITVDRFGARRLRITTTDEAVSRFGDIPFGEWNIQPTDEETLIVYVDLAPDEPLVIVAQSLGGADGFEDAAQAMVDSVAIGGVGPTLQTLFAETPWDIGNIFRAELVGAGCTVPALAFGGVEFELAATSLVQGQGAELWIFDPEGRHVGLREPLIHLVGPQFTMLGGTTGPPRPGDPVETIADAVAELQDDGFELTPRDADVTILGAPATSFDFTGPTVEPWLWFPRSNGVSEGFGFISGEPGTTGELHIAETSDGIVIASLHGAAGTDDAEILRERFAVLLETLRPA